MAHNGTFFPVMAWGWLPDDPATLSEMRECGLTVAGFATIAQLDMVHAAGLQAIVFDPRITRHDWRNPDAEQVRRGVAEVIGEVGGHPAVIGYYIKDEPCADEFAGLEIAAAEVRRLAPGLWPYINLFPDYASPQQLGAASYDEHLERFIATCHPPIMSYDNYSLMEDADVLPRYWTNIERMRAASRRHGLPFWNIVLTVAHFTYRELTAADARFQAFTTLAYGGRGLSYFTYFSPNIGNYRMAPVDQFGHRTPTWSHLQHVNLQIANLAPTLLQLTSDDVYHFGDVPVGTHGPLEHSLITDMGDMPAVVGDFTHADGTRYALVVNKSFHRSSWCRFTYRHRPARVSLISPYTGQPVAFEGEQDVLAPGQGHLLRLES